MPDIYTPEQIRDISEAVYRIRLGDVAFARMSEKDADNGKKMRERAASYDVLTRAYLQVLGFMPPLVRGGRGKGK